MREGENKVTALVAVYIVLLIHTLYKVYFPKADKGRQTNKKLQIDYQTKQTKIRPTNSQGFAEKKKAKVKCGLLCNSRFEKT